MRHLRQQVLRSGRGDRRRLELERRRCRIHLRVEDNLCAAPGVNIDDDGCQEVGDPLRGNAARRHDDEGGEVARGCAGRAQLRATAELDGPRRRVVRTKGLTGQNGEREVRGVDRLKPRDGPAGRRLEKDEACLGGKPDEPLGNRDDAVLVEADGAEACGELGCPKGTDCEGGCGKCIRGEAPDSRA